ncbi:MAG: prepilin-type N-terminal cleavage/methylation domain-containing protein [Rhodoferax sp.]|uniref:type II secretion system protein n=1 Tax=Rhodoferax sp. TaxID=50421 RepID=UPI0013FE7052|nr:prepilin-type N-terminal cleavage/methylation domain-containing protein [Rhodoferax sp.]NDP40261.1 prepilin-type N-terminal cleavage/methylation domain-containing protein [Rhodoferax sp.]
MKLNRHRQHGFTLAEMAIVVVLGGILLAAGLMAGRGQISRAQAQDVIQIASDLQTASLSFKQRYGYLPGDWIYAANQLPGITVGGTGGAQGDGLIAGGISAAGLVTAVNEVGVVPVQLYAAGLIGKLGTNPQMRLQSQFGAVHVAAATAANTSAAYVAANPAVRNVIIFFSLPCEVVLDVDRALDDGVDTTGRAMGIVACTAGGSLTRYFVPL